jgi:hypothetical protein
MIGGDLAPWIGEQGVPAPDDRRRRKAGSAPDVLTVAIVRRRGSSSWSRRGEWQRLTVAAARHSQREKRSRPYFRDRRGPLSSS